MVAVVHAIHDDPTTATPRIPPASHLRRPTVERRGDSFRWHCAALQHGPRTETSISRIVNPTVLTNPTFPRNRGITPVVELEQLGPRHCFRVREQLITRSKIVANQRQTEGWCSCTEFPRKTANEVVDEHGPVAFPGEEKAFLVEAELHATERKGQTASG